MLEFDPARALVTADADDLVLALVSPALDPLFQRLQRTGVESAWYGHVPFAHWIVAACAPRILIELGTHNGVSYAAFCEALARFGPDGRAFAVDTWRGDAHAGHFGDEIYDNFRRFHDDRYAGFSELLRCSFDEALPYFDDGTVDLLHIDGFHTYEAVRTDWESWRPKLSERGVVLFHDTNVREREFGVWRLWAELRAQYPSFEFLHGHGLGVLACGQQIPLAIRQLCTLATPREVTIIRERFALVGERWVEGFECHANKAARQRAEASLAGALAELRAVPRALDALRDDLTYAKTELERARAELLRAHEQLAQAEGENGRAIEALRRDRAELRETLSAREEQGDALEEENRRLQDQAASFSALHADFARAVDEGANLRAELARIASLRAQERAELVGLRRHYHALLNSPSWRLTAPARRIGARFPAAGRQLERAATLAAAAVTGQLPKRLRVRAKVRETADTLSNTLLFDRERYLARYPDVADSGADPLWHYIWTGAAEGYDPHPLFDGCWYLAEHPDVAARGDNPLAHYILEGAALGWDPHPLFDTAHYTALEPEAAQTNALIHFLEIGARRGSDPNPFFDMDAYWEEYLSDRDVADDPLSHYVLRGAAAKCDPHALFDTDWYASTYPDSAGWNPLAHYLRQGRARGYAPCLLIALSATEPPPPLCFAPQPTPDVSIIVPTYGRLFDTLRCLTSIMVHSGTGIAYEVIVADDRPETPIAPRLRIVPGLRVEQNRRNLGFLRSCNHAAALAAGRYLVFLNNDTQVHPGWLAPLVRLADSDQRVGMVGCKLLNADGTIQEAGGILHSNGWGKPYGRGDQPDRPEYNFVREVDVVVGACLLVRHAAWEELGGFDERYAPAYYEEFDLAFALRDRGWRVLYQPASRVTHFDSSSYGAAQRDRQSIINHEQFCCKWSRAVAAQPGSETPLTLARERPSPGGWILVIDDRVPEPDKHAGGVTVFNWLRLFRETGLRVTFAPFFGERPEPYTSTLQQMGIEVLYDTNLPAWLAENGRHLSWVWVARPDIAESLFDVIERSVLSGRLIYYTHDLHFLREQRRFELDGDPHSLDESRRYRRTERDIFRRASKVVTPSSDEVPVIRQLASHADVRVVPAYPIASEPISAFDAESFRSRTAILFVGGYLHPPNVDAALWLVREIMPLVWREMPECSLVLAGSKPPDEILALAGDRVVVPGWLSDLAPLYLRARVSMNPLRYGAGVKGKIVASLQAGLPVVTTAIGNEGLDLADGIEALIGDTAEDLAAAGIRLLSDPVLCASLAAAGRAVVRRRFDEDMTRRTLLELLDYDVCPVCGFRVRTEKRPIGCAVCGAGETDRKLGEAVLRPWRHLAVASLKELAPLLSRARASVPAGPLAAALGRTDPDSDELDLLVVSDADAGDPARLRRGGRLIFPANEREHVADLLSRGYEVRLHEGDEITIVEATDVGQQTTRDR